MSEKIKPHHLERKALLYVRQSSAYQVHNKLESQKLQYAMQERLHHLGWREVEVVDEDLGRSASGAVIRAGFERMVAQVCLGQVGAVAAREVSRFATVEKPSTSHLLCTNLAARTGRVYSCGSRDPRGFVVGTVLTQAGGGATMALCGASPTVTNVQNRQPRSEEQQ